MPGRASKTRHRRVFRSTGGRSPAGWPEPPAGVGVTAQPGAPGTEGPEKARCGPRAARSPGPTPGTRSSPARLAERPWASRSATMSWRARDRPGAAGPARRRWPGRHRSARRGRGAGQGEDAVAMGGGRARRQGGEQLDLARCVARAGRATSGRPGPRAPGSSRSSARRSAADMDDARSAAGRCSGRCRAAAGITR